MPPSMIPCSLNCRERDKQASEVDGIDFLPLQTVILKSSVCQLKVS